MKYLIDSDRVADYLLIAATAIHHNLILVTRNVKHFQRVPDLKLFQANRNSG